MSRPPILLIACADRALRDPLNGVLTPVARVRTWSEASDPSDASAADLSLTVACAEYAQTCLKSVNDRHRVLILDRPHHEAMWLLRGATEFAPLPLDETILLHRVLAQIELLQLKSALQEVSQRDPETGLATANHFHAHLKQEWQRALRRQESISLIEVDLAPNSQATQKQTLAALLQRACKRSTDMAARGQTPTQFWCLLPETDAEGARFVAKRIEDLYHQARSHDHSNSQLAIRVGSLIPKLWSSPKDLFTTATVE